MAFAKAASDSSLWRLRQSSSNFFGKSPIGPDGWYEYRNRNCAGKMRYWSTGFQKNVKYDFQDVPRPSPQGFQGVSKALMMRSDASLDKSETPATRGILSL